MTDSTILHGVVAEYVTPDALVAACKQARKAGYRRMDAYSPFPLEEAADAIGFEKTQVPLLTLIGGIRAASPATDCSTGSTSRPIR